MVWVVLFFLPVLAFAQGANQNTSTFEMATEADFRPSLYAGLIGGVADYSGTDEVKGSAAYGFMIGRRISPQWNFEMSFVQSKYEIMQSRCSSNNCSGNTDPVEMNLTQQNLSLVGKRLFGEGNVRPFLGAGVSYVIREYDNRRSYYLSGREIASPESSRNFQLNLGGGAEVKFGANFVLSTSVSVLFPITKQVAESADQLSGKLYDVDRPIEELNNYLLSLTGIFIF